MLFRIHGKKEVQGITLISIVAVFFVVILIYKALTYVTKNNITFDRLVSQF